MGDENANSTTNPQSARFFNFDFTVDGKGYGNVTIFLGKNRDMNVLYSKNISESDAADEFFEFLRGKLSRNSANKVAQGGLKQFAVRSGLKTFNAKDINKDNLEVRNLKDLTQYYGIDTSPTDVLESKMSNLFGSKKSSYQKMGEVKLIVRHSTPIDETKVGARSRNISSIYIENSQGERFKSPTNVLLAGRVLARHVANGGNIYDGFTKHVVEMVKQLKEMRYFVNTSKKYTFEDETTRAMVGAAVDQYRLIRETLHKLKGQRGYSEYIKSFTEDHEQELIEISDDLRERFVQRRFDERLSDAMPYVARAYAAKIRESNLLAEKIDSYVSGKTQFGLTESDLELVGLVEYTDATGLLRHMLSEIASRLETSDRALSKFASNVAENWQTADASHQKLASQLAQTFIREMSHVNKAAKMSKKTLAEENLAFDKTATIELLDLLSQPLPVGPTGDNAINALTNVFADPDLTADLSRLAERDENADARPLVLSRLLQFLATPTEAGIDPKHYSNISVLLQGIKGIDVGKEFAADIDELMTRFSPR
jgi:hypothetical protein